MDLTKTRVTKSNSPEEEKWSLFREDTLLHAFHSMFHLIFSGHEDGAKKGKKKPRLHELFWYTHQQIQRRLGLQTFQHRDKYLL